MKAFIRVFITSLLLMACNEPVEPNLKLSRCDNLYGCPLSQYVEQVQLELPDNIFPDQLFEVSVKFNQQVTNLKGHLEGASMFMGKIPLMLQYQSNEQQYVAKTIVGSCTDERMKWRLILNWQQDGELVRVYHYFTVVDSA